MQKRHVFWRLMVMFFTISWASAAAKAQVTVTETDSIVGQIFFHLDKTEVDPGYMDNANRIRRFIDDFTSIQQDPIYRISSIDVIGAASPEGYHSHNIELSQKRASSFIAYLERFISLSNYTINVTSLGSDWAGMRRMIEESQVPYKEQVLAIIDSEPTFIKTNGKDTDSRLLELKMLAEGAPYKYIEAFILPYLRESYIKVTIKYERVVEIPEPVDTVPAIVEIKEPEPEPEPEYEKIKLPLYRFMMRTDIWQYDHYKLIFAFRENFLLPFLNIGVEMPIGNRWSIAADHYYPWLWRYWPTKSNKYCYEMQWEELDIKCWLGSDHQPGKENYKNRLLGHSIGVFGIGGYYDIERDWSGNQGEVYGGGICYQYATPLGKKGRAHLEFGLGVGYMYTTARSYDVWNDGGKLIRRRGDEKELNYFGPLKANITLIMPLYRRYTEKYIYREVVK